LGPLVCIKETKHQFLYVKCKSLKDQFNMTIIHKTSMINT